MERLQYASSDTRNEETWSIHTSPVTSVPELHEFFSSILIPSCNCIYTDLPLFDSPTASTSLTFLYHSELGPLSRLFSLQDLVIFLLPLNFYPRVPCQPITNALLSSITHYVCRTIRSPFSSHTTITYGLDTPVLTHKISPRRKKEQI